MQQEANSLHLKCFFVCNFTQVGKLADLVLWNPALFGAKPEIVVKGGQIAWSQMGLCVYFYFFLKIKIHHVQGWFLWLATAV